MINLFLLSTDYKNKKSIARNTANGIISDIYTFLQDSEDVTINEIISEWKEDFKYIYGDIRTNISSNAKLVLEDLVSEFNISHGSNNENEIENLQLLFFSIQTYFSLLVKSIIKNSLENSELKEDYQSLIMGSFAEKHGVKNYVVYDWFSWPIIDFESGFNRILDKLFAHLNDFHYNCTRDEYVKNNNFDYIKQMYEAIVPKSFRHSLGEYYTPDWLAEKTLLDAANELDYDVNAISIMDPTCGSGTFIFKAIELKRKYGANLIQVIENVKGCDINPLAVLTAKTNYILSILDMLDPASPCDIPIYYYDTLGSDFLISKSARNYFSKFVLDSKIENFNVVEKLDKVDLIAGNPPWVNWEYLPEKYRQSNQNMWVEYGLFSVKGRELSFSKEDISVLITYRVVDRFLKNDGVLAFVIRQAVFKSAINGVGFRHFKVDDKFDIRAIKVDDLSKIKVFDNASNSTAIFFCRKGETNSYPVPYYSWVKRRDLTRLTYNSYSNFEEISSQVEIIEQIAVPAIENDNSSLWLTTSSDRLDKLKKVLGQNEYQARTGVFTGGANAVYWLDLISVDKDLVTVKNITARAKRKVEEVQVTIEPDYVYPMLKGSNVRRWHCDYDSYLLCPHSESTKMWPVSKEISPKTYQYLEMFKNSLDTRKGFAGWEKEIQKQEFHAILRIGDYTFSKYKVVWKYIATEFICSVVGSVEDKFLGEKILLPNEKIMYVGTDSELEAYYLCGVLSSSLVSECVKSYMNPTSISAHVLNKLNIPSFDNTNDVHIQIAGACKDGHENGDVEGNIAIIDTLLDQIYV